METTAHKRGAIYSAMVERLMATDQDCRWIEKWAGERRETPPGGIVLADWNDKTVERIGNVLEKRYGCELDWRDGVDECGSCGGAIQTEPDHYGWTPSFVFDDSGYTCKWCMLEDVDTYLDTLRNDPSRADSFGVDLSAHGFRRHADRLESGFHPGQTDDPRKVFAEIRRARPSWDVVFQIDNVGQFDIRFSAWVQEPGDSEAEDD